MKISQPFLLMCVMSFLCLTSMGAAQQGGQRMVMRGGNDSLQLLNRADVQEDLGLSQDQIQKIKGLLGEMNQAIQTKTRQLMSEGNTDRETFSKEIASIRIEYKKKINDLLTKDQQRRLNEIDLQLNGFQALTNPDIQKEIGLTEDQKKKISQILSESQRRSMQRMQELRQSGAPLDREAMQSAMQKERENVNSELEKILTSDQLKKFRDLKGKPFTPKNK